MLLDQKSFNNLQQANPIVKAQKEGRIVFFSNGSYKYTPSKEYLEMRKKFNLPKNIVPKKEILRSIKMSLTGLSTIVHNIDNAKNKGIPVKYVLQDRREAR